MTKTSWLYLALVMPVITLSAGNAENPPENQQIKDSVAAHYSELRDDLQKGDGVYLTSLLSLLHTPADEKTYTMKRMRALSEAYPALPEFAERVPDLAHRDQAPTVSAASAVSEADLQKLFGHMKYLARIHLSLMNGYEFDAIFRSFDPSRETIWVKQANSTGGFDRKVYPLRTIKNVTLLPI